MTTDRETTTGRPLLRWGLAVGLGLAGAVMNLWLVPILTQETPNFLFGGIPVFLSFIALGPGPGVLSALLSILVFPIGDFWAAHPAGAVGLLIYVVEGLGIAFLYRKTRSVPLAAALFWFGGGWLLTVVNYHLWMGLSLGYTALFVVKQLLNALINGLGAELLLSRSIQRHLAGLTGKSVPPVPLADYTFRRIVLLTLIPLTLLGVLHARAEYEEVIGDIGNDNRAMAWEAVRTVDEYLQARHETLGDLARALELVPNSATVDLHLEAFLDEYPDAYLIARSDSLGRVTEIRPERSATGELLIGLDLSDRGYFRDVREGAPLVHGEFVLGDLEVRTAGQVENALVIARGMATPSGRFEGALIASLDPAELRAQVQSQVEIAQPDRARITLLDHAGTVIASTIEGRPVGIPADSLIRGPAGQTLDPYPLPDRDGPVDLSFFPPPTNAIESVYGLNLIFASFQPVLRSGWGVLAETPSEFLYARMIPVTGQILALVFAVLLLVVLVVVAFSRHIARPLAAAADTARRITAGEFDPGVVSPGLRRSPLLEPRELHESLEQMRVALQTTHQETRARQRELEAQLLQAQKMEAVGLLAGGIAHDFNNMLTPIVGIADLGREDAPSDTIREHFREIGEAAARAREVVQQLLAFSRKQVLARVPLDLGDVIRDSDPLLRSLLRENIEVELRVPDVPLPILADPTQIQQVLVNLAVNAQDAMPGGGRLTLSVERIQTGGSTLQEEKLDGLPLARLTVRDTGEGIPAEHLGQIFDPFFTTKFPGEGTGLGLATVYGIVRQHDGAVRVQSRPDEWTAFELYFPILADPRIAASSGAAASTPDQDTRATEPTPSPRPGQSPETVLLVEDDAAVRRFVRRTLERHGFDVVVTRSAEEALTRFDEMEDLDLLLTDVVLPGRNGSELYTELAHRKPGLRALFMSGYSHDVLGDDGPPPGTRFLAKPFELQELLDEVRATIDSAPKGR